MHYKTAFIKQVFPILASPICGYNNNLSLLNSYTTYKGYVKVGI